MGTFSRSKFSNILFFVTSSPENKISSDTANLNTIRRDRLKLVWVNNNKMINKLEEINQNNKKKYIKLKKTVKEYSKDF